MASRPRTPGDPFALHVAYQTRLARAAFAAARPFLAAGLGLTTLGELYRRAGSAPGASFEARALHTLGIRIHMAGALSLPPHGPVIIAANHPTGALDGLVLSDVVRRSRHDVRVLTNHLLARIPELGESAFFVDPFGGPEAIARSRAGLRAAHLWLRSGGALVVFPAGSVAPDRTGHDDPWHATIGRLALATRAQLVPVHLDGGNSRLFYAAGRVHPGLRTLLLGRELLNKRGRTVRVFPGRPIDAVTLQEAGTADAVTALARRAVDALSRTASPIAPPVDAALLAQDIMALPGSARLLSSGAFDVYHAGASSLPHVLPEIGRLRELTFRAVGEGTGRAVDLDRFDRHYGHLFVWQRSRREIVGAYRVGATDTIAAEHGVGGLYTSTLFRYDQALLRRIGPALELGRSFVRAEYQRRYSPLLLLWKGIGRIVSEAPRYRVLYGPVSISSRYQDTSQQLLRAFLAQNHGDPGFEALVEAVNPPGPLAAPARDAVALADVDALDTLIRRLEGRQGVPILLRQYLRLNATLLGFNVDPAFGDALDALMMVDLRRLPITTLQRYLGAEAASLLPPAASRAA